MAYMSLPGQGLTSVSFISPFPGVKQDTADTVADGEVTGGGLPGWLQRTTPTLRTADLEFLQAAEK